MTLCFISYIDHFSYDSLLHILLWSFQLWLFASYLIVTMPVMILCFISYCDHSSRDFLLHILLWPFQLWLSAPYLTKTIPVMILCSLSYNDRSSYVSPLHIHMTDTDINTYIPQTNKNKKYKKNVWLYEYGHNFIVIVLTDIVSFLFCYIGLSICTSHSLRVFESKYDNDQLLSPRPCLIAYGHCFLHWKMLLQYSLAW